MRIVIGAGLVTALTFRMVWRSDPVPLSLVLVTMKAGGTAMTVVLTENVCGPGPMSVVVLVTAPVLTIVPGVVG